MADGAVLEAPCDPASKTVPHNTRTLSYSHSLRGSRSVGRCSGDDTVNLDRPLGMEMDRDVKIGPEGVLIVP